MSQSEAPVVIGWREWLALPDLGIPAIKAKIDTGARTSAIHSFELQTVVEAGQEFAVFSVHPIQDNKDVCVICRAPVKDRRIVRDSGGHEEERIFIETLIKLPDRQWRAEFSLTSRENMSFRMLLGRTSMVAGGILVNPSLSFTQGRELSDSYNEATGQTQ